MKVVVGYPKNWEKIKSHFNIPEDKPFILTVGDTLYNPHNLTLDKSYLVHEEVHSKRQLKMGVDKYLKQYIYDKEFRLQEELAGFRAQFQYCVDNIYNLHKWTNQLAQELSSPEYGNLVSFEEAKKLIGEGIL